MEPTPQLTGAYDARLVCLSVLIAVLAAYAALDLAGRVSTNRGNARVAWLCSGAVAMGSGIWAMHYVGMEAYRLPIPVLYDWPSVLFSLFAAILASAGGLFIVSRRVVRLQDVMLGSVSVGGGIAAMHYIGMDAMRLRAMCVYSPRLVALSILVAIVASFAALFMENSYHHKVLLTGWKKLEFAVLMGIAISSMHYIGMSAVTFAPTSAMQGSLDHAVSFSALAVAGIVLVTLLLLSLMLLSASVNRRFVFQAERLIQTQNHLKLIFDNMTEGIVVMDRSGQIVLMNKAANGLLASPDGAEVYASAVAKFEGFSLDGKPLAPEQWPSSRAFRGEFVQNFQMLYRNTLDGEMGAREISTAPVAGLEPGDFQIIVTSRDTTQRWLVDEARNRLASIVESSDDAIIGKNTLGVVTSWNRGAEKLFGYAAPEMVGQSIKRLLPPELEYEEDNILARILRGETVDHFETTRRTKSGATIHVSLTISPIKDTSGCVVGASKIVRDVTEKKLLERQLHQSQKLEAVGQLTGGIAHDFNNLLGIMIGNLDLLERIVTDNAAAVARVHTAQRAATRGADLTRRLLSFASREDLNPVVMDLSESILSMLKLAERTLGPDVKITTAFDPTLPPVLVDINRFENAILNLFVNARDAMPKGGTLAITTSTRYFDEGFPAVQARDMSVGSYARVSISDTGCGMSSETITRAFEPFFTTKPSGKGTGLGLAMVYGFVKQSGGTVRIHSEVGFGTTISLYLPFAKASSQIPESPVFLPRFESGGEKVLVVDDEDGLLEIAATYLLEMGYQPLQARSGAEAIQAFADHPDIALLISDIVLGGGMNGVELAQKIHEVRPGLAVVYCSGFPADALAESNDALAGSQLLQKPYQRLEFNGAVKNALRQGLSASETRSYKH